MSIIFNMSAVVLPGVLAVDEPPLHLADLRPGDAARLVAIDEPGELGERLMELGLTPGVGLKLLRRGLFGDPLVIEVRGSMLSVRKSQARALRVVRG